MNKNLLFRGLISCLLLGLIHSPIFATIDWVGNMFPTSGSMTTIDEGNPHTVYIQVYKAGVTEPAGQGAGIICELYYGQVSAYGMPWMSTNTMSMTYNVDIGNNDEYQGTIAPAAGLYEYTCRCSDDGGTTWNFADLPSGNGRLTVNSIPLPVELSALEARPLSNAVILDWTTASENSNSHFIIERSRDTKFWEPLGEIKGAGYSLEPQAYSFRDLDPQKGDNYYRLKQVDFNGQYEYSDIVIASFHGTSRMNIYPNPTSGELFVDIQAEEDGLRLFQLFDSQGRLVKSFQEAVIEGPQTLRFSLDNLPKGNYWLYERSLGFPVSRSAPFPSFPFTKL